MSKKKQDVDAARAVLRDKGLRATPARIAVLNFLNASERPVSHLDATEELEKNGFEKSTVFRALVDLTDAGLLRKMELGDHVWRFERVIEQNGDTNVHPHLLCVDCGTVQCLDEGEVELKAAKSLGPIEEVLLRGHCKECQ